MSFLIEAVQDVVSEHPIAALAFSGFAVVGLFKVTVLALSFSAYFLDVFVLPAPSLVKYGAKNGKTWALVTGCTQGIGEEFVYQLASKGFNVGLISRTESKLAELKGKVEAKYPKIEAKYLALDVSKDSEEGYASLRQFASSLGVVGVLVNNVGQSHSIPVPFLETSDKELRDIITINNVATLKITQIVVPYIDDAIKTQKIKKGLVLNVGSIAGATPTPLLATYSGSKAFLQAWNNALARELAPHKIDVQLYIAYLVTSAMSKIRKTSLLIPNPRGFVKSCFQSIGRRAGAQDRYATSTPYWSHGIFYWIIENTLGVWSKTVININYNMHVDIRKRALRKQARLAKEK